MSTYNFIVSFCNNKKKINSALNYISEISVDVKRETIEFRDRELVLPDNINGNGVTGVCFHQGQMVLLLQRMPSTLVFINERNTVDRIMPLKGLKGVHTIVSWKDEIYLSVTNQDRVVVLRDDATEDIWTNHTMSDQIHLNSLCVHDDQIFASAFGVKKNKLWSSADSGYVFNLSSGEKVIESIWHPHSTFSYQGEIYCCDSSNQRIVSAKGELLSDLPGYTRGLYMNENVIVFGSSMGRQVSHSTGIRISNKSDQGILAGECGINVLFRHSNTLKTLDLSDKASEVFEIKRLVS